MLRTILLMTSLMLAVASPTVAKAQGSPDVSLTPAEEILITLRDHGYRILVDERTWLGRQRVIAEKNGAQRELVFNPGTGEILRDYAVRLAPGRATQLSRDRSAGGAGTGDAPGASAAADSAPAMSVGESLGIGRAGNGDGAGESLE